MKYTIFGYNQKKAIAYKLDLKDLLILRWIQDFFTSDKILKEIVHQEEYGWLKYEFLLNDIPIIEIQSKDGLYRRLLKLTQYGFLKHQTITNHKGTFSFYRIADKITDLLSDNYTQGSDEILEGVGRNSRGGSDEILEQNIHLLNNQSTKDKKEKINKKEKIEIVLPTFIQEDIWNDFVQHRKEIKKPLTKTSISRLISKLTTLHNENQDVNTCLLRSIENGWQGVFANNNKNEIATTKHIDIIPYDKKEDIVYILNVAIKVYDTISPKQIKEEERNILNDKLKQIKDSTIEYTLLQALAINNEEKQQKAKNILFSAWCKFCENNDPSKINNENEFNNFIHNPIYQKQSFFCFIYTMANIDYKNRKEGIAKHEYFIDTLQHNQNIATQQYRYLKKYKSELFS